METLISKRLKDREHLADDLFDFLGTGINPFIEVKNTKFGIEVGGTKQIKKTDLFGSKKGDGQVMVDTHRWVEAGTAVLGRYMDWEVTQMWKAFHGGELDTAHRLDPSLARAGLSHGIVGGRGYKLVQVSPTMELGGVDVGRKSKMADLVIAMTYNDDPRVMEIPSLIETQTDLGLTNIVVGGSKTVFEKVEWDQLSPLTTFPEKIDSNLTKKLRDLFDSMAEGMISAHEAMILRSGQVSIGAEAVSKLESMIRTQVERNTSDVSITRKRDGHIYSQIEIDQDIHFGEDNRYSRTDRFESFNRAAVRTTLTEWRSSGEPADLMMLIKSGVVSGGDLIDVAGTKKTVAQVVRDLSERLMEVVAESTTLIASNARVVAGYEARKLSGLTDNRELNLADGKLVTVMSTWPAAYIEYVQKFYFRPIAEFLDGRNSRAAMVEVRNR